MNKPLGITLLITSWASISFIIRDAPLLTQLAGYVLTFACGMLAGYVGRTR